MKSTTRPQENLVVGVGLGIFSFYNLQLYIFTTLQLLQLLHFLVNQVVNGEHCGESSEHIKIPNPTPTTRFSCGLVVDSNTKIYVKNIFPPRLKALVVNLVVFC